LKLIDKFKGMAKVNINDVGSCYLWSDLWENKVPMQEYPELYSFTKSKTVSLAKAKGFNNLLDLFHLPLSQQAFAQLAQLESDLQHLTLNEDPDHWSCIWNSGSSQWPEPTNI
jgi:hypothetical protein